MIIINDNPFIIITILFILFFFNYLLFINYLLI